MTSADAPLPSTPNPRNPSPDFMWDTTAPPRRLRSGLTTTPELLDDINLPITGTIPPYVNGRLFRNGPGIFEVTHQNGETTHLHHWFDGIATVHRFQISGASGTVSYKNRRTMPDVLATAEAATSKAAYRPLSVADADPCRGLLGTLFQMWRPFSKSATTRKPPTNVSVTLERIPNVGHLVSRTDSNDAAVLDVDTLESKRPFTFGDLDPSLEGALSAAHGARDPDTGEYFNFVCKLGRSPATYTVFAQSVEGGTRPLADISAPPCYTHSIAATKRYVVLVLFPFVINPLRLLVGDGFLNGAHFDKRMRTRIFVIDRKEGGVVAEYGMEACFAFHFINAFDDDETGDVCVDVCMFKDETIMRQLFREHIAEKPGGFFDRPVPKRLTLARVEEVRKRYAEDKRSVAEADVTVLSDAIIELPRVAPKAEMRAYKYGYGISNLVDESVAFSSIVKMDVVTGEKMLWTPADASCGEPIFVPKPGGEEEDEGVLLSVVLDAAEEKSFLAVIDAQTMTEIARASVPRALPLAFHGQFMEESFAVGAAS